MPKGTSNAREWREKFIRQLRKLPDEQKDRCISRLLSDGDTLSHTAALVEFHIHGRTRHLQEERKARGRIMRKRLENAIAGIRVGAKLFSESRQTARAETLLGFAEELDQRLNRCDEAFNAKRLGVASDHVLLAYLHHFLEVRLSEHVPISTLATLLEMGYLADGKDRDIDVDSLRRNLSNFRRRNPIMMQLIRNSPRLRPETK